MKFNRLCFALIATVGFTTAQAQVKVGNNPSTISTNSALEVEATNGTKMIVTKDSSKVGIGTVTPTNALHVTGGVNPLRIEGIQSTSGSTSGTPLVIDANGVVMKQSSSIPFPTLRTSAGISTNYNAASNGASKKVPITQIITSDGNFSTSTNLYTVPTTGVYQISGTISVTGYTPVSTVSIALYAAGIKIADLFGDGYTPNANFGGTIAGTVTIPLTAGTAVGLSTVSCYGCGYPTQTYVITPQYTNLTIIKMN